MRFDKKKLIEFVTPYYADKDIMHNMWHIELVKKKIDKILEISNYKINYEFLILAMYFHGFIYSDEKRIRVWLNNQGYKDSEIEMISKIAGNHKGTTSRKLLKAKFCTMPMFLKAVKLIR